MSRLYRGRRLLQGALRDFAVASGYVKAADDDGKTVDDKTVDLASYRASRKAGGGEGPQ